MLESDVCKMAARLRFYQRRKRWIHFGQECHERRWERVQDSPEHYVHDGLAACSDEVMYKELIAAMSKDLDLSDSGELKWFLGGKVDQDREKGIVQLSQEQYCNDVLQRF